MNYFRALLLGCQHSPGIAAYGYLNFFYYKTLLIRNSKNKKESSPTPDGLCIYQLWLISAFLLNSNKRPHVGWGLAVALK